MNDRLDPLLIGELLENIDVGKPGEPQLRIVAAEAGHVDGDHRMPPLRQSRPQRHPNQACPAGDQYPHEASPEN